MGLKKYTEYSLLGFKILNSWHSILSAYFLLLFEFLITPYFGIENVEYLSGLLFIFLANVSIMILIFNALLRISKVYFYYKLFSIPLLLYFPISLNKTIFTLSKIRLLLFDSCNINLPFLNGTCIF